MDALLVSDTNLLSEPAAAVAGRALALRLPMITQTATIVGAVNWITRWFDPAGPATSDEIGRVFADYLIRGLRTGGPALGP